MKGSTHLAIGAAIGAGAAAVYFPSHPSHSVLYVTVAAFSALAADLDGASLLTAKLNKLARWLRGFALWSGLLLTAVNAYLYFYETHFFPSLAAVGVAMLLLGLMASQGNTRNTLVSLTGAALFYVGVHANQSWLLELGLFIALAPWLKHRGMTHTVWALLLWGKIGWGLERQLNIEGMMVTALAGYASHLLADTFTPNGVKWLYPLYKRSFRLIP